MVSLPLSERLAEGAARLERRHLVALTGAALAMGAALALLPTDPRPLAALLGIAGAAFLATRVHLAAAALAFVIAGNLAGVATNEHGLPSPSIALGVIILAGIVLRRDSASFLPPPVLVLLFGTYVLVVATSAAWAANPDRALATTDSLVRDMILATLVAVVVRRTRSLRLTLWAIVASIALVAAASTLQYLTGSFTDLYLGLSGAEIGNIVGGTDDWRIVGSIGDPNHYAQTLLIGLPIALTFAIRERRPLLRGLALLAAAVTTFAVYTTFSRGAFLALVVLLAALLAIHRPGPRLVTAALLVGALALAVLPAEFRDRMWAVTDVASITAPGGIQDVAVQGRVSEMLAGAAMIYDEPLLGVGAGNYPPRYQEYAQRFQLERRPVERSAHSLYLEIPAETGALGALAFLGILAGGALALRDHRRRTRDDPSLAEEWASAEGLGLAALSFLLTSVVLHAAHARSFWLLMALVLTLAPQPDTVETPEELSRSARPRVAPGPRG